MPDTAAPQLQFTIDGMHCENCAKKITAALQSAPGVQSVKVSLAEKSATVSLAPTAPATPRDLMAVIKSAGFTPTAFSRPG